MEASLDNVQPKVNEEIYVGRIDWGLPFHPTCFQIFKRVSLLRSGNVDVQGLWDWRDVSPPREMISPLLNHLIPFLA